LSFLDVQERGLTSLIYVINYAISTLMIECRRTTFVDDSLCKLNLSVKEEIVSAQVP